MRLQPYLFFDGRCEEAVDFYRRTIGAEVTALLRFDDAPESPPEGCIAPGSGDRVMHMSFRVGDLEVLASDGNCGGSPSFQGFALALSVPDADEAARVFAALGEGGQVQMPLGPTFFSPAFGMLADRYGVAWMVVTDAAAP